MSAYFVESNIQELGLGSSTSFRFDPTRSDMSYPLSRGKACVVCRAHKIKCDGVRPFCGSCRRKPKANRCEWDSSKNKSRVTILIDTIKALEARIFELEHPELVTPSVTLYYPYRRDEAGSPENCLSSLNAESRHHNSSFTMTNTSYDSSSDAATPSTYTSNSPESMPSVDGENPTSGLLELKYTPAPSASESASTYYHYQNIEESYITNSLSAAFLPSA